MRSTSTTGQKILFISFIVLFIAINYYHFFVSKHVREICRKRTENKRLSLANDRSFTSSIVESNVSHVEQDSRDDNDQSPDDVNSTSSFISTHPPELELFPSDHNHNILGDRHHVQLEDDNGQPNIEISSLDPFHDMLSSQPPFPPLDIPKDDGYNPQEDHKQNEGSLESVVSHESSTDGIETSTPSLLELLPPVTESKDESSVDWSEVLEKLASSETPDDDEDIPPVVDSIQPNVTTDVPQVITTTTLSEIPSPVSVTTTTDAIYFEVPQDSSSSQEVPVDEEKEEIDGTLLPKGYLDDEPSSLDTIPSQATEVPLEKLVVSPSSTETLLSKSSLMTEPIVPLLHPPPVVKIPKSSTLNDETTPKTSHETVHEKPFDGKDQMDYKTDKIPSQNDSRQHDVKIPDKKPLVDPSEEEKNEKKRVVGVDKSTQTQPKDDEAIPNTGVNLNQNSSDVLSPHDDQKGHEDQKEDHLMTVSDGSSPDTTKNSSNQLIASMNVSLEPTPSYQPQPAIEPFPSFEPTSKSPIESTSSSLETTPSAVPEPHPSSSVVSVVTSPSIEPVMVDNHEVKPSVVEPSTPMDKKTFDVPQLTSGDSSHCDEKKDVLEEESKSFLSSLKSKVLNDFVPLNNGPLNISSVDNFNNIHVAPRLDSIIRMDYFRFVKLNLKKKCNLWSDDMRCAEKDCTIKFCDESDLPEFISEDEEKRTRDKMTGDNQNDVSRDESKEDAECSPQDLSEVNETISSENELNLDSLFECESEDDDPDSRYIDLLLNPERYTGYRGESAHRIWSSIYSENCFFRHKSSSSHHNPFSLSNYDEPSSSSLPLCYEERIFYRVISGLHSSINIHLSASYPVLKGSNTFGPNLQEFKNRFEGREEYLKNLYFVYLLELKALIRIESVLLTQVNFFNQNSSPDGHSTPTRDAIRNLLKTLKQYKWSFNESNLLKTNEPIVALEFASHFRNITSVIMDCVACDKCRLWGKIQIHGLRTAFKILTHDANKLHTLHISRHEISSLFNAVTRLSKSIEYLDTFNKLLAESKVKSNNQHLENRKPYVFSSPIMAKKGAII